MGDSIQKPLRISLVVAIFWVESAFPASSGDNEIIRKTVDLARSKGTMQALEYMRESEIHVSSASTTPEDQVDYWWRRGLLEADNGLEAAAEKSVGNAIASVDTVTSRGAGHLLIAAESNARADFWGATVQLLSAADEVRPLDYMHKRLLQVAFLLGGRKDDLSRLARGRWNGAPSVDKKQSMIADIAQSTIDETSTECLQTLLARESGESWLAEVGQGLLQGLENSGERGQESAVVLAKLYDIVLFHLLMERSLDTTRFQEAAQAAISGSTGPLVSYWEESCSVAELVDSLFEPMSQEELIAWSTGELQTEADRFFGTNQFEEGLRVVDLALQKDRGDAGLIFSKGRLLYQSKGANSMKEFFRETESLWKGSSWEKEIERHLQLL